MKKRKPDFIDVFVVLGCMFVSFIVFLIVIAVDAF